MNHTKRILQSLPQELLTLSKALLNAEDTRIYQTLSKLWLIIDKADLETVIMASRSKKVENSIHVLADLNRFAYEELKKELEFFRNNVKKDSFSRNLFLKLENIEHFSQTFPIEDLYFSSLYEQKIKDFFKTYIKENDLDEKYIDWFSDRFMGGEIDPVYEDEHPPYHLNWGSNLPNLEKYSRALNEIQNKESSKAWYNFLYLDNLAKLLQGEVEDYQFPVGFENYFFAGITINEGNLLHKYLIDDVKSAWICIMNYLEHIFVETSPNIIQIKFSPISGKLYSIDGSISKLGINDDEYKVMKIFSEGLNSVKLNDILVYNDSDARNDLAKSLRRKTGLSLNQLINKKGFLCLSGVTVKQADD